MNKTVKIGIIFGLIWVLVKVIFYLIDPLFDITPAILINIFLLLCAISMGLLDIKRKETEESNVLNDIKNGMKAGVPYTLVVAISIYLFYGVFNPEYNRHQIAEVETEMEKMVNDPVELAKIKKSNAAFEVKTKEEILMELKKGPKSFFNAGSTFTLSLLAMLVLSTLYSILVTVILRYVFPYKKVLN